MIIPYSTDAPIYHFPWMTIVLIVANVISYFITGGGIHNHGWLLTYGNGLHPLEWVTWNFLHFGPLHLIGNMFFLWSFGIIVEGKLGWWKYLATYMTLGIIGGFITQVAMLWFDRDAMAFVEPNQSQQWFWSDNTLYAQDDAGDFGADDDDPVAPPANPANDNQNQKNPAPAHPGNADAKDFPDAVDDEHPFGAGGASLAIYGLMAIVLIWAPRNEIHCLWMLGFRGGTLEIECLYFCGLYIVLDVITAIIISPNVATTEVLHSIGAITGLIAGTLFVKLDWVDCEKWDLFSIIRGDHSAANRVGDWQNYYAPHISEKRENVEELAEQQNGFADGRKKKKIKPRLKEIDNFEFAFEGMVDDEKISRDEIIVKRSSDFDAHTGDENEDERLNYEDSDEEILEADEVSEEDSDEIRYRPPPPVPDRSSRRRSRRSSKSSAVRRVRSLVYDGRYHDALIEFLEYRSQDPEYRLPQEELRLLSNGLFQDRAAKEAAPLLEEYIRRFPEDSDRQRVKLAVLYVKMLQRPTAALKLLAKVNPRTLADDYREIHQKAARYAQQMVSEGVSDLDSK